MVVVALVVVWGCAMWSTSSGEADGSVVPGVRGRKVQVAMGRKLIMYCSSPLDRQSAIGTIILQFCFLVWHMDLWIPICHRTLYPTRGCEG